MCDIHRKSWDPWSDHFGQHGPCADGNTRRMGERTNISKGGSISVPSYGNSRQNSGTNITKHLGSIGLLLCYCRQSGQIFFGSIERVRRRKKNEKSREYRYVERRRRVCSPVCTVQQKNREGNQHSHFGRGLINQFQMGVPNGELVVMYTTSSYRICLLYTSPSPRDLSTSRMPSSA